jgi:hypothetical protein
MNFARSQEESMLRDPDGTLTDPYMSLDDCIITSPVNAPCIVSNSGLDSPDDISVHSVEDVCCKSRWSIGRPRVRLLRHGTVLS